MTDPAPSAQRHQDQPTLSYGTPLEEATAAVVLLHGRGATAHGMLSLADRLSLPGVAFLAPQAAEKTWYPNRFIAPLHANEPSLSSAMRVVSGLLSRIQSTGIPRERVVLVGFSQGACLGLEYVARHPHRYGGVAGLSGGLMGPTDQPLSHEGNLRGTPVLLGCSDTDPHIPLARVHDTASALQAMGAAIDTRIYPMLGHTINDDEVHAVRQMIASAVTAAQPSDSLPPLDGLPAANRTAPGASSTGRSQA